jgi:predicted nucleic acid-binding protein
MNDHLLDSGILVRYLRKSQGYRELLGSLGSSWLYISAVTRFEVVRGMRKHEQKDTLGLLNSLLTIPVDSAVADLAGELFRTWRSKNMILGEGDVLIAATALHYELDLVTTNARHFPMPELTVWQVDDDGQIERWSRE